VNKALFYIRSQPSRHPLVHGVMRAYLEGSFDPDDITELFEELRNKSMQIDIAGSGCTAHTELAQIYFLLARDQVVFAQGLVPELPERSLTSKPFSTRRASNMSDRMPPATQPKGDRKQQRKCSDVIKNGEQTHGLGNWRLNELSCSWIYSMFSLYHVFRHEQTPARTA